MKEYRASRSSAVCPGWYSVRISFSTAGVNGRTVIKRVCLLYRGSFLSLNIFVIMEYIEPQTIRFIRAFGLYMSQMRCMSLYTDLFTRKNSWNSSMNSVMGRSVESFIRNSNTSAKCSARPIVGIPSLLSISSR